MQVVLLVNKLRHTTAQLLCCFGQCSQSPCLLKPTITLTPAAVWLRLLLYVGKPRLLHVTSQPAAHINWYSHNSAHAQYADQPPQDALDHLPAGSTVTASYQRVHRAGWPLSFGLPSLYERLEPRPTHQRGQHHPTETFRFLESPCLMEWSGVTAVAFMAGGWAGHVRVPVCCTLSSHRSERPCTAACITTR